MGKLLLETSKYAEFRQNLSRQWHLKSILSQDFNSPSKRRIFMFTIFIMHPWMGNDTYICVMCKKRDKKTMLEKVLSGFGAPCSELFLSSSCSTWCWRWVFYGAQIQWVSWPSILSCRNVRLMKVNGLPPAVNIFPSYLLKKSSYNNM